MKKSFIALAVASALTVPMVAQADTTLFGSARFDVTDTDSADDVDSATNRIRFGFSGEETMDSGLTAGYFIRLQASGIDGNDGAAANGNVGVSKVALFIAGGFGKLILGDADSPVQRAEGVQTLTAMFDGSLEVAGSEFSHGGISYESNVYSGFQFRAGVGDVDSDATSAEDSYGFSVDYSNDLLDVSIAAGEEADASLFGIGGKVKLGAFTVGAAYSDKEDFASYGSLSAKYVVGKLSLAAQYETRDLDAAGAKDWDSVNVSAQYALGGNASVTLGAIDYNDAAEAGGKSDTVTLRYAISF
ncbi:MAG: porin [Oceanospirillaceae bacterium]|nr:porin [Oceanospirillaceae bacterium]